MRINDLGRFFRASREEAERARRGKGKRSRKLVELWDEVEWRGDIAVAVRGLPWGELSWMEVDAASGLVVAGYEMVMNFTAAEWADSGHVLVDGPLLSNTRIVTSPHD
jgi:hypothetical protein